MNNLRAFIWSMETYREDWVLKKTWSIIQMVFYLDKIILDFLNLPNEEKYSMFTTYWVTGSKKILEDVLPDFVLADYFTFDVAEVNITKIVRTQISSSTWIDGKYGLMFLEFEGLEKESEDENKVTYDYTITEDSLRANNSYIRDPFHYSSGRDYVKIKSFRELQQPIKISNQAKLFLSCAICKELSWQGRHQKYKVLQYTEEQILSEEKELFNRLQGLVDILIDHFNVQGDHLVVEMVRKMMSVPPSQYE